MQAAFPDLDFVRVYQKFVDHHTKKGTEKVTKATLVGWFKRERPSKTAQASANGVGQVKTAKPQKDTAPAVRERLTAKYKDIDFKDPDSLYDVDWKLGKQKVDFDKIIDLLHMTRRTNAEAKAYVVEVMGSGVDVEQFFSEGEWYVLFEGEEDGDLEGNVRFAERKKAEREQESRS